MCLYSHPYSTLLPNNFRHLNCDSQSVSWYVTLLPRYRPLQTWLAYTIGSFKTLMKILDRPKIISKSRDTHWKSLSKETLIYYSLLFVFTTNLSYSILYAGGSWDILINAFVKIKMWYVYHIPFPIKMWGQWVKPPFCEPILAPRIRDFFPSAHK